MTVGRYAVTVKRFARRPHHSCVGLYEELDLESRPGPPHRDR